jgi:hypothetical protein
VVETGLAGLDPAISPELSMHSEKTATFDPQPRQWVTGGAFLSDVVGLSKTYTNPQID